MDWAVNSGNGRAAKPLQRAAGAHEDGAIGPQTLMLASNHNKPADLVDRLQEHRESFYRELSTF